MLKKIKVAFVKFGGMAAGGTEKALQTLAANLPKDKFDIDYYYCDSAPYIGSDFEHPDTDPDRKKYMEEKGVNLIKFNVAFKDVRNPIHPWAETDFWDIFVESKYDILQTARAGHPEYPFVHINGIPQIDLITLPGMAEKKSNVYRTVHISEYQAKTWIDAGGDAGKTETIPLFDELPPLSKANLRNQLQIKDNTFVFGFHQRVDDGIYSPIPLQCYSQVEDENTVFILMGGSEKYEEQAKQLELKNFYKLPHSGNKEKLHEFLATLDVFAHGRADGETFGLAIAEAMYYGLPIVSHAAPAMGHEETIGNGGLVAGNLQSYTDEMKKLKLDKEYCEEKSSASKTRFENYLSLEANISKWTKLYNDCMKQKDLDKMDANDFWNNLWE